ncbi:MAG: PGPGW domain-containing protein [Nocardioides sp.]
MNIPGGAAAKRLVLETLGWVLVVVGTAALVLPGPGLLCIFAGLVLLSQQYEWAERRLEPIRLRALRGAAESVETWPRIVVSGLGVLWLLGIGVLWMLDPAVPDWWPNWWIVTDEWWLFGGFWTGVSLVVSGILALALVVYSFRRFYGKPEAVLELTSEIEEADLEAGWDD